MQINPLLLDSTYNIPKTLFKDKVFSVRLSNNYNELLGRR